MAKKKYSVHWENETAVSFEVDGVAYESLDQIPDKRDKRKIIAMMEASSAPDLTKKNGKRSKRRVSRPNNSSCGFSAGWRR